MTPPVEHREPAAAPKVPRGPALVIVGVCVLAVACSAGMLFRIRARPDSGLFLLAGVIIAALFAVAIPVALWQQKRKQRSGRPPWPVAAENPHFARTDADVRAEGKFSWTPEMFIRLTKGWCRTPEGTSHRRTMMFLHATAIAGILGGAYATVVHEWSGLVLVAVSLILLLFARSCRIRLPDEVNAGATIRWRISGEKLTLEGGDRSREIHWSSTNAIFRTQAGFIFWPGDFITAALPAEAFANREQLERCADLMRAAVFNYVDETA